MIDSGVSVGALSRRFADQLSIPDQVPRHLAHTDNGTAEGYLGQCLYSWVKPSPGHIATPCHFDQREKSFMDWLEGFLLPLEMTEVRK